MNQTSLVITRTIAAGTRLTELSEFINVPFTPDRIMVSNIYYSADVDEDIIYRISSNMVSSLDSSVGVCNDKFGLTEPMMFVNERSINGTQLFTFDNGGLNPGVFTMTITFYKM